MPLLRISVDNWKIIVRTLVPTRRSHFSAQPLFYIAANAPLLRPPFTSSPFHALSPLPPACTFPIHDPPIQSPIPADIERASMDLQHASLDRLDLAAPNSDASLVISR